MYYATYKGVGVSDVAEFLTEQERDNWVSFKDGFSRLCDITSDNTFFEREVLTDEAEIHKVINDKNIKVVRDDYDTSVKWYLRSLNLTS